MKCDSSIRLELTAIVAVCSLVTSFPLLAADVKSDAAGRDGIFSRQNLVAWCIVPFDGKKRGPAERAAMCARLGLKKIAYDWRNQHVATFEEEILAYRKHGLEYFAFWSAHDEAFRLFEKYDLHPQIWRTLSSPAGKTQAERVKAAAESMLSLVERTRQLGSQFGLYNHGGWGGEPENLVAVCQYLREHHDGGHVGIVYNFHHAHSRIDELAELLTLMKPYLLCLNLNGMTKDGDQRGKKILPVGAGELDVKLLKVVKDSGYEGPVGVIGHTQDDVEQRLQDNLDGLDWILPQLDGKPAGEKPRYRTWQASAADQPASAAAAVLSADSGTILKGRAEFRLPPITVECRVTLTSRGNYNILVASDTKKSAAHWEIFSMRGDGTLTAYTPGLLPDHTRSKAMICDGKSHRIAMLYEANRIRLLVDGRTVADQKVTVKRQGIDPGGLGIGRLVEGGLGCSGPIDWVRISKGIREDLWSGEKPPARDDSTLLSWQAGERPQHAHLMHKPQRSDVLGKTPEYSAELVQELLTESKAEGDAARGMMVFAAAKSACLSCHKVGMHGGAVGPPLTEIAKQRKPHEIVESVIWPKRHVKPEFTAHQVVTTDGRSHQGYIVKQDDKQLVLRDPTKPDQPPVSVAVDDVELRREVGTLMPDNLVAAMSRQQLRDLLQFLNGLGTEQGMPLSQVNSVLHHAHAHLQGPVSFPFDRKPLHPENWPHWEHEINRDRLYDFYAKEADWARSLQKAGKQVPPLLMEYPGLDGGALGHWGNQNEGTWASDAWNSVKLGTLQAGIFRDGKVTVPRGVCVQLGNDGELACCFNPDTLSYDAVWKGGFLKFSSVRHGFMHGVMMDGESISNSHKGLGPEGEVVKGPFKYRGFSRVGKRVVFAYRIGNTEYLDSPWVEDGKFVREVAPANKHPLASQIADAPRQWAESFTTTVEHGTQSPYAVDSIQPPFENSWNVPIFGGGLGFVPDGSALVCTMHGDVWRVTGFEYPSKQATWTRFASGLHQCQGMIVDQGGIFVLGRDQITRLYDFNEDGEADFYECFSNAFQTSSAGHDFICGLERDEAGYLYTSSGNQGIVRISPDGESADVVATGFRNPDGIGRTADGFITVPCSEGSWTPASMICGFRPAAVDSGKPAPFFGYRGPRNGQPPELPLVYLPRGVDNSAGGQQVVNSDRWGPLKDQLLHFSFGTGSHLLILKDEVDGQVQGAAVPLPGEFLSGIHRGRFNPKDGQLYVTGMQGWGSYTPQHGCFQRVRYTGDAVQTPKGFHVYRNGVMVEFSDKLDPSIVGDLKNHFAQCWNYRYSGAYGSPEFSTKHAGMRGHDHVPITSAHVAGNGRALFLEMPDLQPVNQLHLLMQTGEARLHEMFLTVHRLDSESFIDAPGLKPLDGKTINAHPILADLAMATRSVPNPHAKRKKGGRKVTIETAGNLSFATRSFTASPGELIEFTLVNPDVVPHNWALLRPGTLRKVGDLSNRLISDPDAAVRHYIPKSDDVLAYTNVVLPKDRFTIYFNAPKKPGRYPFLCTFPGHWLVMNGEMIVE